MSFFVYIWLASIGMAVCCLAKEEWHNKAKWYLCWALFPFPIIIPPRRFGVIKSWILFLISPCMMSAYFIVMALLFFWATVKNYYVPHSIPYHSAEDLKRLTGVEFPDIVPVDSTLYDDPAIGIWFVIKEENSRQSFFQRIEKACIDDTCCWHKDSLSYRYLIEYPERPIDRTKGTHIRKEKEEDGEMWIDYVEVKIPFKCDTIFVSEKL